MRRGWGRMVFGRVAAELENGTPAGAGSTGFPDQGIGGSCSSSPRWDRSLGLMFDSVRSARQQCNTLFLLYLLSLLSWSLTRFGVESCVAHRGRTAVV